MAEKLSVLEAMGEETTVRPIHECLPPALTEALSEISDEVRSRSVDDLEEVFTPSPTMRRIKISFWNEYNKTIAQGAKAISISSVCREVCSRIYFYQYVVQKEYAFAWLFHPPVGFDKKAEEALEFGIDRLRNEILTAPLYSANGAFNEKNAAVVLNAIKFLDARVKGSPLQRIEQKSLHVHKTIESGSVSREELDEELARIHATISQGAVPLQITGSEEPE